MKDGEVFKLIKGNVFRCGKIVVWNWDYFLWRIVGISDWFIRE